GTGWGLLTGDVDVLALDVDGERFQAVAGAGAPDAVAVLDAEQRRVVGAEDVFLVGVEELAAHEIERRADVRAGVEVDVDLAVLADRQQLARIFLVRVDGEGGGIAVGDVADGAEALAAQGFTPPSPQMRFQDVSSMGMIERRDWRTRARWFRRSSALIWS